jgi:L-seryl-tRNA(Ser) seleniumtransferase
MVMNIFERIGISPMINATGAVTRLSGGIMAEEAARAMFEATQYCVDMTELQARAWRSLPPRPADRGSSTAGPSN